MDIKACFFVFCTIGISLVSDGQSCISPGTCVANTIKSYYQFGGYLDACGNSTGTCKNQGSNGKTCPVGPPPKLVTYGRGPGNTKKIICYGFGHNIFGRKRRGSFHLRRVICRSYDDTPVPPPVLNSTLKETNYYEVDVGGSLTIECEADSAKSYEWKYPNGSYIHISTLRIADASFEHQGIYVCYARGQKGRDAVSEPQVVVVKGEEHVDYRHKVGKIGYLQFLVKFDDAVNSPLASAISAGLQGKFNFSDPKNKDKEIEVFKLLHGTTVPEVYKLLNSTLWNVFANFPTWTYTIITTGYCESETTDTANGELTFPDTLVGVIAESSEISLTSTSVARATRMCRGNYKDEAVWDDPVITDVRGDVEKNITKSIKNIVENIAELNVTSGNASYVADVLKNVTETDQLDTKEIDSVVDVLHKVVMTKNTSETVTISIVITVDNLVVTSESNETEGTLSSNTSASLLETFEQQIDNVRDSGQEFNYTTRTIEVYIIHVLNVDVWVIYRTYFVGEEDIRNTSLGTDIYETGKDEEEDNDNGSSEENIEESDQTKDGTDQPGVSYGEGDGEQEMNATVIQVDRPAVEGLINKTNNSDPFPISFLLHRSPTLFNSGRKDGTKIINTLIVSASVDGDVKDLPDESNIITSFHPIERHRCAKPSCVFWDPSLNDGIGEWSQDGCHYVESQDGEDQYTCRCDHLTNFAVLLDIKGDIGSEVLDYLTIIGCVVSIWCIFLTIFTYLGIKKLRTSRPQQIVLNICFALLGLYLSFLAGIDQTLNHIPCVIFGALIHFFTLAAVTWMSVEAINMYLLFVKVFNAQINYFMIKASLIGWGIPAVIVLISAVLSPDSYSNCKYCFPDSTSIVFYVSVLSVVALLLTFNLVIFVLVTRKLTCARTKMSNRSVSTQETLRRLQNAVAISVLLGVTWISGFLAIGAVRWIFNFLFCLTNSFQGFFIFLLFCVRQQEVRSAWMTWLRLSVSKVGPTSTSATTGTDGVSKSKGRSGEKSTSGVSSKGKMELSDVKNVSEVSEAKDPLNVYAEVGETSYDEVKAAPSLKTGPKIYQGYTELDARHRVLPPLPEEGQYSKRINSFGNPQTYMEIMETPKDKQGRNQTMTQKKSNSTKSTSSDLKAYGFVDFTAGTLLQGANVRSTSDFLASRSLKGSKGKVKDKARKGSSTKN